MKKIEFLEYYFLKIIKNWWIIIIFIPDFIQKILGLDSLYFSSRHSKEIEDVLNWLSPWWIWVALIAFWFIHLRIIYKLWKEDTSSPTPTGQYDSIPESYTNIIRRLEKLMPENPERVRENFARGYKCLTEPDSRDIKTAISIHFNAYKIIRDFLIAYFTEMSVNVQISIKISQIRTKFEDNLSKLEEYNNEIGQNNNLQIGEYEVRQLIENINNNLNSLFAHFKL